MDSTAIVVLGMHASGTSLLSHILIELGVNMGKRFTGPVKKMPTWENVEFMKMNVRLLKKSGGNWTKPPSKEKIAVTASKFHDRMVEIIAQNQSELWGFKDPRTALTVNAWHNLLSNPKYICVYRKPDNVAKSILQRGPCKKTHAGWVELTNKYNQSIRDFLSENEPEHIEVAFESLISANHSMDEVKKIAELVGIENKKLIEKARKVIKLR